MKKIHEKMLIFFYCGSISIDHALLFVVCLFENSNITLSGKGMKGLFRGEGDIPIKTKSMQEKRRPFI